MNIKYAIIIGACVGVTALLAAAHTTRKQKSHRKAMTFKDLLRDNNCTVMII